jgi:hypothetical protein
MRQLILLAALLVATSVQCQPATQRIRGDVTSLEGNVLGVRTRAGEVLNIRLADNYTVAGLVKVDRSVLVDGAYIGTASLPGADGTLSALEVLVFPDNMRGAGEGHGPWDLQPGSQMTNATIAQVVRSGDERRLTLRYKDGEKTVVVPESAPIVTFAPGERALLVPGAHIILTATRAADGTLGATRVTVGKDGLVPPM